MQPDMNQLMRAAQKAQEAMQRAQEELARANVDGTSGGGAVTVSCTGALEFTKIKIKREAVDPEDVETLEDLVLTAIKDACQKAMQMQQQKASQSMSGLNLPPGFGF